MKHWTEFLPEAGTISRYGSRITILEEEIINAEKQLEARKIELRHEEAKILERAQMEWSAEEIEKAKSDCVNDGLHPVFSNILKTFMP